MHQPASMPNPNDRSRGFILPFTVLLTLGVTAISVGTIYNNHMDRLSALNHKHKLQADYAADGVMTLIAQEILQGRADKYFDTTRYGKIYGYRRTLSQANPTVTDLKNSISSSPSSEVKDSSYYLGSNWNLDQYGVKWTGYILPPVTGSYTFFVRADYRASFYLSQDTSKTGAKFPTTPTCSLAAASTNWPTGGSGISQPKILHAGRRYYFEFYHTENTGNDVGQIGWSGPEWIDEKPIAGERLSVFASDPTSTDDIKVGTGADTVWVRYLTVPFGLDQYRISTESVIRKPASSDTAFRSRLSMTFSTRGKAVQPPNTVNLPVIYYDFRTDHFNPEFEADDNPIDIYPPKLDSMKGMVANKFISTDFTATEAAYFGRTTIPKPRKGAVIQRSCYIDKWFRSTTTVSQVPRYGNTGTVVPGSTITNAPSGFKSGLFDDCALVTPSTVGLTTDAFDNNVIKANLTFTLTPSLGANTYVFSRRGDFAAKKYDGTIADPLWVANPATSDLNEQEFFPIDNQGFGADGTREPAETEHNMGFCMELHTEFKHAGGLNFEFVGDDDVWVFVNDTLVMDLGGVHWPVADVVSFDDLPLRYGKTYNFDFFYCERRTYNSSIRIVTNIPVNRPKGDPVASWSRDYGSLD